MNSKTFQGLLIAIVSISGVLQFLSCIGGTKSSVETIEHPPFTIKKKNTYNKRYDINTNSRVNNSRSYYSIYYKDQTVSFPQNFNKNSGVAGLWKVYILKDAPQPALLAGSKSVYLIIEEEGNAKMIQISPESSDFGSIQWLDSENGQPGIKQEIYSSDDTSLDCQLSEGQFLLINKRTVLNIADLAVYHFEPVAPLDNGYSSSKVIGFSPDKDKIAYMGSKYERSYYYAIIVYNFKTGEVKTLPFDRNETRLIEAYEVAPDWLAKHFEWKQKDDGSYGLEKIQYDTPPNWEGHFGRGKWYSISPVKIEMLDIMANFTKEYLQLSDAEVKVKNYNGDIEYVFTVGENIVEINYLDKLNSVYFSDNISDKDEEGCIKIVREVGEAFNNELTQGKYQDLFTKF
jgi:hypothetical protein